MTLLCNSVKYLSCTFCSYHGLTVMTQPALSRTPFPFLHSPSALISVYEGACSKLKLLIK